MQENQKLHFSASRPVSPALKRSSMP
jgi:hypothetical protein